MIPAAWPGTRTPCPKLETVFVPLARTCHSGAGAQPGSRRVSLWRMVIDSAGGDGRTKLREWAGRGGEEAVERKARGKGNQQQKTGCECDALKFHFVLLFC